MCAAMFEIYIETFVAYFIRRHIYIYIYIYIYTVSQIRELLYIFSYFVVSTCFCSNVSSYVKCHVICFNSKKIVFLKSSVCVCVCVCVCVLPAGDRLLF